MANNDNKLRKGTKKSVKETKKDYCRESIDFLNKELEELTEKLELVEIYLLYGTANEGDVRRIIRKKANLIETLSYICLLRRILTFFTKEELQERLEKIDKDMLDTIYKGD